MNYDNRRRAFSEIVSVDAWHPAFNASRKFSSLHVDVAFAEGRVGGDQASNVRFMLRVRRATVVVILPASEPANIDRSSVSRDAPDVAVTSRSSRKSLRSAGIQGAGQGSLSVERPKGRLSASVTGSIERLRKDEKDQTETTAAMRVIQIQTQEGHYCWRIEPSFEDFLFGRPWDAATSPRLRFEDMRHDRSKGVEPNIIVEVRCKREDLIISNISLRGSRGWADPLITGFSHNKRLAAEALIRTKLAEAGLIHGDISDPYADICISAVIAEGVRS